MKKNNTVLFALLLLSSVTIKAQFSNLLDFNSTNGSYPYGSLSLSGNQLFGMTQSGGANDDGCIFTIHTDGSGYRDLWDFIDTGSVGNANGELPDGSLLLIGNRLYGMTSYGGENNYGEVFAIDTDGSGYKDLLDFNFTNGATPEGSLTNAGSQLFGMTRNGGLDNYGLVFSLDTNGSNYKILLNFIGTEGINPYGALTISGYKLFGMTLGGGSSVGGNVFSIDTSGGAYVDLLDFDGTNGEEPHGSVALIGNKLYGMTYEGGANGDGLIFSLDTNGTTYKDLLDFNNMGSPEGRYAWGSLTPSGSLLYGMTTDGGLYGYGVVFSVDTDGTGYTDIINFDSSPYGSEPYGDLTVSGSTFYGMTNNGAGTLGNVFSNVCHLSGSAGDSENVSCYGASDGNAFAIIKGGSSPYTYSWSNGSSTAVSISNPTGAVLSAGTYTVTMQDVFGCSATATATITQPTAMTIIHDSLSTTVSGCTGEAAVTVNGGVPPYTYLWATGGQTTDTIMGQCMGQYCCTINDNNGCIATTCVTVDVSTGENSIGNSSGISIYPDPNAGYITVAGVMQGQVIEIYDYLGQKIADSYQPVANSQTVHFDISAMPNGVYLVRIQNKDGSVVTQQKIVKIK